MTATSTSFDRIPAKRSIALPLPEVKYESQKLAFPYLLLSTLLFPLMIVFGIIGAAQYIWPTLFLDTLNFSIAREAHLNLLIFWLLLGLMGATYYLVPEEAETEIFSKPLAWIQFAVFAVTGVAAMLVFMVFKQSEGKPFVEAPFYLDVLIAIGAVIFLINIGLTILRSRWTPLLFVLFTGLAGLSLLYLIDLVSFKNLSVDYFFWWWIIHLWVEGTWEMVAAAVMAFVLFKITGVDRNVLYKWLYIEVGLTLVTGIVGTGHHYYWIGTPDYWLPLGAIFSGLEPVPIALMVWDTLRHTPNRQLSAIHRVAWYWVLASAIGHFVGAGVWGFAQTLPQINEWTHGTQVTASHGHFAFFAAYGALIIAAVYLTLPQIRGLRLFGQRRGMWAFWLMNIGMVGMVMSLTVAGVLQTYLWRVLGMDFMVVRDQYLAFWLFWRLLFGGALLAPGVVLFVWDFVSLSIGPAPKVTPAGAPELATS